MVTMDWMVSEMGTSPLRDFFSLNRGCVTQFTFTGTVVPSQLKYISHRIVGRVKFYSM